jgi:hypothetical protein
LQSMPSSCARHAISHDVKWTAELLVDLPPERMTRPFVAPEHDFATLDEVRKWFGVFEHGDSVGAAAIAAWWINRVQGLRHSADLLPVQQREVIDFGINLTAARALGLIIPETILARATEVVS